jgi:glutathione S-transferase
MTVPALYHSDLDDDSYKVRLLLSLLDIAWSAVPVEIVPVFKPGTAPFLAMNPLGRLPILRDGDLVMHGAEAILGHLARSRDVSARWFPERGPDFARVMQWLNFSARDLAAASAARSLALFGGAGDQAALAKAARCALRVMDDHMIESRIDGREWFVAAHPTIADVAVYPAFALSRDHGIDHDEYPALRRWARRLRSLPGFVTMPGIPEYS